MLLLDHFRPPLVSAATGIHFTTRGPTYIASDLNRRLPEGYFAEPNVQFAIEIDAAACDETRVRSRTWFGRLD